MWEKITSGIKKLTGHISASAIETPLSQETGAQDSNYTIEDGVLVSYVVTENCCVIPEGVTELKSFAINKNRDRIEEVILPSTIRYIKKHNFSSCRNLRKINFPEGLLEIGEDAFKNCRLLKEVILPDSLQHIGAGSFSGCPEIEHVRFGNQLQSIGEQAFCGCTSLKEIDLPGGIERVGEQAFSSCGRLERVIFHPGLREIGDKAFEHCTHLMQVEFGLGLKRIGAYAFFAASLHSLRLPEGVESIGEGAFSWCEQLENVCIPEDSTKIGKYAFSHCSHVRQWDVPQEMLCPQYRIEDGVLKEYTGCVDLQEVVVPEGVIKIEKGGIPSSARQIIFPESLQEIGQYACDGFRQLEQVSFAASSVTHIGRGAFQGCCSLISVALPPSLISLGDNAFRRCSGLTSIILPQALTKIESGTFCECTSLKTISIPLNVTAIGSYAFKKCKNLQAVALPNGVRQIDYEAFCDCISLNIVQIPDTVERIGFRAFQGCTALKDISFPQGLKVLEENVLAGCLLEEFEIPEGVTELERGAFSQCTQLKRITIPDSVTKISRYAFIGCTALETVDCTDPMRFELAFWDTPFFRKGHPDAAHFVCLPPDIVGNHLGRYLIERGYSGFEPDRMYHIRHPDENGIVEVSSWCDEDGPDQDGFGREDYYDWWYLDEELNAIPGVEMIHSFSNYEKRENPAIFQNRYSKAVEELKKRKIIGRQ